MTREEARSALGVVARIKAAPEYGTLTTEELQILQNKENRYRAVATGQEERIRVGESPQPSASVLEMAGESAKGVGRQVHAMGAAALQSVPGVVPAIEAAGDLGQEMTRGYPKARKILGILAPPSGTTEDVIQEAPLPVAARAFGALSPMAAATGASGVAPGFITRAAQAVTPQVVQRAAQTAAGALNTAQAPASALYQGIQRGAAKLVGPGTSHAIAGAGTGAAVGAVDAGLRRVAPAVSGQDVPEMDWYREVVLPGAAGLAGASIPGIHNMMTRKGFQQTEGSDIANTFVKTKQSGREQDPRDPLFGTGQGDLGVGQVADKGRQLLSNAEARGNVAIEAGKKALADTDSLAPGLIANAAEKAEKGVRASLTKQDASHREAFNAAITRIEDDHIPQGNLFGDMDALVATKANEAGKYLNSGERLREVWKGIKGFIDTGRVRDYRTALTELKTLADRGTPEQAWVAQQLYGGIKEHLKASHPGVARAYDEYRTGQNKTGRGFNTVYGEESPRDIGQKSPDPADPYIDILPTQEVSARKRLARVGDPSAEGEAWRPALDELGGLGLKGQLDVVLSARKRIAEAKASNEAGIAAANERAGQDRLLSEEMATDALKAKHAVEMSRFPGYTEVISPVAQGITAMTGHNPGHSAAVAGMAGATFARRLGQFAQSNIALKTEPLSGAGLPVGAASQAAASFTPGAMSLQRALIHKEPEDQAAALVKMARGGTGKLRASIGELLRAKNE